MQFKRSHRAWWVALLFAGPCGGALGQAKWGWELKRQNTGRGEPGESTRTTLRAERYPDDVLTLVRFDLPLPDDQPDFNGSPLHPRLGDIKIRVDSRALLWGSVPWVPRAEMSFPTANPASLGAGKLQLALGARASAPLGRFADGAHRLSYGLLVLQSNSVAGDESARDINNTKLELEVIDSLRGGHWSKLTLKPVIDWVMDGKTGAVLEWEGGVSLSGGWRVSLMLGARAWGEAVAGTYGRRFELTLGRRY